RSSAVMPATYGSNSAFLTRLPSGVSSWTKAGSALFLAPAAFLAVLVVRLVPVVPALFPALRRDVRAAVLSTVTCAPPSVRPPGLPVGQCGSPATRPPGTGWVPLGREQA